MKDFSHYLQSTCRNTNDNSIHSKGLKLAIALWRLMNDLAIFSKNANG